jgi:hypothetical protein
VVIYSVFSSEDLSPAIRCGPTGTIKALFERKRHPVIPFHAAPANGGIAHAAQ